MIDRINTNNIPLEELGKARRKDNQSSPVKGQGIEFSSVLTEVQKKSGLQFSAHAKKRMMNREIILDKKDLHQIEEAVNRLQRKGGNESLLLHRDVAYLVSVKNKTVITAIDEDKMDEHIFTNIDSAIILKD